MLTKKKIATEEKLTYGPFKVKVGTLDKKNPSVIYAECGVYVEPIKPIKVTKDIYRTMNRSLRRVISSIVLSDNNYEDNHIFILDFPYERVGLGKKTYVTAQIHVKLKPDGKLYGKEFKEMHDENRGLAEKIIAAIECEFSNDGYGFK